MGREKKDVGNSKWSKDNDCPLVLPNILENYLMQTEGNNTVIARSVLFYDWKRARKTLELSDLECLKEYLDEKFC